jgi:hypothetical protein
MLGRTGPQGQGSSHDLSMATASIDAKGVSDVAEVYAACIV